METLYKLKETFQLSWQVKHLGGKTNLYWFIMKDNVEFKIEKRDNKKKLKPY